MLSTPCAGDGDAGKHLPGCRSKEGSAVLPAGTGDTGDISWGSTASPAEQTPEFRDPQPMWLFLLGYDTPIHPFHTVSDSGSGGGEAKPEQCVSEE